LPVLREIEPGYYQSLSDFGWQQIQKRELYLIHLKIKKESVMEDIKINLARFRNGVSTLTNLILSQAKREKLMKFNARLGMQALFLIPLILLSGCFRLKGAHVVNHYGNSDSGGYSLFISNSLIASNPEAVKELRDKLQGMSNPRTIYEDDGVYLQDVSGDASMEYFYDNYNCDEATIRYGRIQCTFSMNSDNLTFTDWLVNWKVFLPSDVKVLSSNHHRVRTEEGITELIWYFDGDVTSSMDIKFTVSVPIANY
jgi:hypothetical protein